LDAVPALYPTLEVRGSLALAPGMNPANYAVPVVFSADDIARAQDGYLITKIIYLEQPEQALAVATRPDGPVEIEVPADINLEMEARQRGRLVLIVRLGERQATVAELAARAIAGTVLLPGERLLAPPALPPQVPWACVNVYDPIIGPRPLSEECVKDGGDAGPRAGIGPDGRLHGLDPADTVAEYSDSQGGRHVACSNRVCIFAPRFGVVRTEQLPAGYNVVTRVGGTSSMVAQSLIAVRTPSLEARQMEQPEDLLGREKPNANIGITGLVTVAQLEGLARFEARLKGVTITGVCQKPEIPPPDRPLVLCKSADRHAAQVGDIITFTLRYTNSGGQPITDVAVSDSLTNRLEFVPGSARSDREAVFTAQENEAGSLVLRWEIGGALLPGQTGVITFQARVR
jgi:uncharacterized repeat protein (TIGR01451 family)